MGKRAVIFDFGGVIFQTQDYAPRHRWDKRLGLAPGTVERAVHNDTTWKAAQRGELDLAGYWADVAARLGVAAQVAAGELATDFYSGDRVAQEVLHYIHMLRGAGHTVALLSNDAAGLLRPRLARLQLDDLFDPLVISSEIGVMKPAPAAYQAVLAKLGRLAGETIFIDDMLMNVQAANALGIQGVHYQAGMALEATLEPLLRYA